MSFGVVRLAARATADELLRSNRKLQEEFDRLLQSEEAMELELPPMSPEGRHQIHSYCSKYKSMLESVSEGAKEKKNKKFSGLPPTRRVIIRKLRQILTEAESDPSRSLAASLATVDPQLNVPQRDLLAIHSYLQRNPVTEEEMVALRQPGSYGVSTGELVQNWHLRKETKRIAHLPRNFGNSDDAMWNQRQNLPVYMVREEILQELEKHRVLIVDGETGCGKSTQIPQYIMEDSAQRGDPVRIVCTQPRRIAAISVADRVAAERRESTGDAVGYHIRLEKRPGYACNFVTCGVLLRSLLNGEDILDTFTHIILDEVHERELFSDFVMMILRRNVQRRKNLRIIFMSATIQHQKAVLQSYFPEAVGIHIAQRTHEVKTLFLDDVLRITGFSRGTREGGFGASHCDFGVWKHPEEADKPSIQQIGQFEIENWDDDCIKKEESMPAQGNVGSYVSVDKTNTVPFGYVSPLTEMGASWTSACRAQTQSPAFNVAPVIPSVDRSSAAAPAADCVNAAWQDSLHRLAEGVARVSVSNGQSPQTTSLDEPLATHQANVPSIGAAPVSTANGNGTVPQERNWDSDDERDVIELDDNDGEDEERNLCATQNPFVSTSDLLPTTSSHQLTNPASTDSFAQSAHFLQTAAHEQLQATTRPLTTLLSTKSDQNNGMGGFAQYDYDTGVQGADEEEKESVLAYERSLPFGRDRVDMDLLLVVIRHLIDHPKKGSILVFLAGYDDIMSAADAIEADCSVTTERRGWFRSDPHIRPLHEACNRPRVLTLHSQMPSGQQKEIFGRAAHGQRKIILSTNIAEASITIDDVVFVIDGGRVKEKRHCSSSNVSSLREIWISKSSAEQRKGRAGRCQPGIVYRLYSHKQYMYMANAPKPEMLRAPLHAVLLQAKLMFPNEDVTQLLLKAPEPPFRETIEDALTFLQRIEALDAVGRVTELGRLLIEMPLDPQLAIMVLHAITLCCLDPVISIVACLSDRDPFALPGSKNARESAQQKKSFFAGESYSDHFAMLRAFQAFDRCNGNPKKFCFDNFLSYSTMQMVTGIRKQLYQCLSGIGLICEEDRWRSSAALNVYSNEWSVIKAAITAGCFPGVAVVKKTDTGKTKIRTSSDNNSRLFPGSVLRLKPAKGNGGDIKYFDSIPTNYLAYNELTQLEMGVCLKTVSCVTGCGIALFAGPSRLCQSAIDLVADAEGDHALLEIDRNWLVLKVPTLLAKTLLALRLKWRCYFVRKLRQPRHTFRQAQELLEKMVELLRAEERGLGMENLLRTGKSSYVGDGRRLRRPPLHGGGESCRRGEMSYTSSTFYAPPSSAYRRPANRAARNTANYSDCPSSQVNGSAVAYGQPPPRFSAADTTVNWRQRDNAAANQWAGWQDAVGTNMIPSAVIYSSNKSRVANNGYRRSQGRQITNNHSHRGRPD